MITIKKELDELNCYKYLIQTDEGSFEINWGGDLDLYWEYVSDDNKNDSYKIDITKENYFLYSLFDEIYDSVITCNPYKYAPKENLYNPFEKDIFNKDVVAIRSMEYLLEDEGITWISDDGTKEDGARVTIKKCDDKYELTFKRGYSDGYKTHGIRFRNSGSRYTPFNTSFVTMYNKLKYYDEDNRQIHMEEYIYSEKIKKMKGKKYEK